jgi:hypothetical protein
MSTTTTTEFSQISTGEELSTALATALRRELLLLAKAEEEQAALEASRVSYWQTLPDSVPGHRAAAQAIRARADLLPAA